MTASPIMNYDNLKKDIITYLQREGDEVFIEQLPRMIARAQNKLSTILKDVLGLEQIVEGILPSLQANLPKPNNFLSIGSFIIYDPENNDKPIILKKREREYIEKYLTSTDNTGTPIYYGDQDINSFIFGPIPKILTNSTGYPFRLSYYQQIIPLSDGVQTNWFTEKASFLLFHSCLAEAHIMLSPLDVQVRFEQLMQAEAQEVQIKNKLNTYDKGTLTKG